MNIPFLNPNSTDVEECVLKILQREARNAEFERRSQGRLPFFQPARITLEGETESQTAFTRDIAECGIGLLHYYPIEAKVIAVDLNTADGDQARLNVAMRWCVPCGDGWYISGGVISDASFVN